MGTLEMVFENQGRQGKWSYIVHTTYLASNSPMEHVSSIANSAIQFSSVACALGTTKCT